RPIDLPRAVKFKPRKSHRTESIPSSAKQGRMYEDYCDFTEENPNIPCTELDTVIGEVGGKVIMTIHFVNSDFMAGLFLDNKTAAETASEIGQLKQKLASHGFVFGDIIPLLLTDNGGEFSCVSAFENNTDGEQETKLFFCEPAAAYEKPHTEKNHTMFRDIVPQDQSFDSFTQETVNLISPMSMR
ncbi:MAG: IS30 family transposase, partial [Clostridia bacterium]|nr:IS30 family transposase [Clostridia bacterium]